MTSDPVQRLSYKIAINHINQSMTYPASSDDYKAILEQYTSTFQEKVIVMIGAGVSYAAADLPLASDAAKILQSRLNRINPELFEAYEYWQPRIAKRYRDDAQPVS